MNIDINFTHKFARGICNIINFNAATFWSFAQITQYDDAFFTNIPVKGKDITKFQFKICFIETDLSKAHVKAIEQDLENYVRELDLQHFNYSIDVLAKMLVNTNFDVDSLMAEKRVIISKTRKESELSITGIKDDVAGAISFIRTLDSNYKPISLTIPFSESSVLFSRFKEQSTKFVPSTIVKVYQRDSVTLVGDEKTVTKIQDDILQFKKS